MTVSTCPKAPTKALVRISKFASAGFNAPTGELTLPPLTEAELAVTIFDSIEEDTDFSISVAIYKQQGGVSYNY
jgi:hypothetical protein